MCKKYIQLNRNIELSIMILPSNVKPRKGTPYEALLLSCFVLFVPGKVAAERLNRVPEKRQNKRMSDAENGRKFDVEDIRLSKRAEKRSLGMLGRPRLLFGSLALPVSVRRRRGRRTMSLRRTAGPLLRLVMVGRRRRNNASGQRRGRHADGRQRRNGAEKRASGHHVLPFVLKYMNFLDYSLVVA